MKIDNLLLWEAFVAVAKAGGFAGASRALKTPSPQVSKRVAKLEALLDVRLFTRSTRVVKLTDEGSALLDRANTLLEDSLALAQSFQDQGALRGVLRLTTTAHIAHRFLLPVLKEYRERYPEMQVVVDTASQFENLIESKFDLAIRIDEPMDSQMIFMKLFPNEIAACASPGYFKRGAPKLHGIKDLRKHPVLVMDVLKTCGIRNGDKPLGDYISHQPFQSTEGALLVALAKEGMGIVIRSRWDVEEELQAKQLVEALPRGAIEPFGNVYAVIPSRKYLAPRVRKFLDLVMERAPVWGEWRGPTLHGRAGP